MNEENNSQTFLIVSIAMMADSIEAATLVNCAVFTNAETVSQAVLIWNSVWNWYLLKIKLTCSQYVVAHI